MKKTRLSPRQRGAEPVRGLRAALCAGALLVAQGLAPLQAQTEVPLAAEAAGMGQPARPTGPQHPW